MVHVKKLSTDMNRLIFPAFHFFMNLMRSIGLNKINQTLRIALALYPRTNDRCVIVPEYLGVTGNIISSITALSGILIQRPQCLILFAERQIRISDFIRIQSHRKVAVRICNHLTQSFRFHQEFVQVIMPGNKRKNDISKIR